MKPNKTKKGELSFITSGNLYKHVKTVIDSAKRSLVNDEKKFYKNSVDPFSALFDALWQNIPISEWIKQEKSRQNQKTLQNALGDFHQNIVGSSNGWKNLGRGKVFDVKNDRKKIIAEIKNKYNTTKGNHKIAIYDDLKRQLGGAYKGYTAYYVEIIPRNKKTYNKPFTPSDNNTHQRRAANESIRVIDGKSFYALAAGDKDALQKLYAMLPSVIAKVLGKSASQLVKDSSFTDLFDRVY